MSKEILQNTIFNIYNHNSYKVYAFIWLESQYLYIMDDNYENSKTVRYWIMNQNCKFIGDIMDVYRAITLSELHYHNSFIWSQIMKQ